jgi:hypothetical protein
MWISAWQANPMALRLIVSAQASQTDSRHEQRCSVFADLSLDQIDQDLPFFA